MVDGGILAVFAHPDDEAFGIGATMARYAARGVPVTMVSATRGEVGEIAPGSSATPENLMLYRARELSEAMAILGVRDVRYLGFRDSGMQGTKDNDDPRAFMRAHPAAVVHQVVRLIRAVRPAAVVTWDSSGGYGHPDHIAIHHHTTAAFHAAGDPARFVTAGEPFAPAALFYLAFPVEEFARLIASAREASGDVAVPGDERGFEVDGRVRPNCIIDVEDLFDTKMRAIQAHRSQIGPDDLMARTPPQILREFFAREYFHRAHPALAGGAMIDDLFAGL